MYNCQLSLKQFFLTLVSDQEKIEMLHVFKYWRLLSVPLIHTLAAFIVISAFAGQVTRAQEEGKSSIRGHYLGFHFDGKIASYREDLIVPLGFNGPGLSLGAIYTSHTENNLVHIRLRVGAAYLKNQYSHEAYVALLDLRPSWIRKLTQHRKYGEFWAGISIPLQMNNLIFESWDDAHLYWLTAHSLGFVTEWKKRITQQNNAVVRMEIPILSLVSRPQAYRYNKQDALNHFTFHFTEPNRSLHLETLDTYRGLFIQMLVRREIGHSLLNLGFEFQYNYCRKPQKIWGLTSSIIVTYQWRIEK
jgi:hypothetical protein